MKLGGWRIVRFSDPLRISKKLNQLPIELDTFESDYRIIADGTCINVADLRVSLWSGVIRGKILKKTEMQLRIRAN